MPAEYLKRRPVVLAQKFKADPQSALEIMEWLAPTEVGRFKVRYLPVLHNSKNDVIQRAMLEITESLGYSGARTTKCYHGQIVVLNGETLEVWFEDDFKRNYEVA